MLIHRHRSAFSVGGALLPWIRGLLGALLAGSLLGRWLQPTPLAEARGWADPTMQASVSGIHYELQDANPTLLREVHLSLREAGDRHPREVFVQFPPGSQEASACEVAGQVAEWTCLISRLGLAIADLVTIQVLAR